MRFEVSEGPTDLDKSIQYMQKAVVLAPARDLDLATLAFELATLYEHRYAQQADTTDLNKAINYMDQAVSILPDSHPLKPGHHDRLADLLKDRFSCLKEVADLEGALVHGGHAVSLTPREHHEFPCYIGRLATYLSARYELLGDSQDLDQAIAYHNQAVSFGASPGLFLSVNSLGYYLQRRYFKSGDVDDLDKSIDFTNQAFSMSPPGAPWILHMLGHLGESLWIRFRLLGNLTDLDGLIACLTEAIYFTPQENETMLQSIFDLGIIHILRYWNQTGLADLDKAVTCFHKSASETPQEHPDLPRRLSHLSIALNEQYRCLGDPAALDQAIDRQSQAISLTLQGHPDIPSLLHQMSMFLFDRFNYQHEIKYLENAIKHVKEAISLTHEKSPEMSLSLDRLGLYHLARFDSLNQAVDLEKAIHYGYRATELDTQKAGGRSVWLGNLAHSLLRRFEHAGDLEDTDKAIECLIRAVALASEGEPNRVFVLYHLGHSIRQRFDHLDTREERMKAVVHLTQAGSNLASRLSEISELFDSLKYSRIIRSELPSVVDPIDISLECFRKASLSSTYGTIDRFNAAMAWARLCRKHRTIESLEAYGQAMRLLPRLVWLGSDIDRRYENISNIGNMVTEATAAAIGFGEYKIALEWLEEGRSIVWKQMLRLRTPLDELAAVDQALAAELQQVSQDLDTSISLGRYAHNTNLDELGNEQNAQRYRRLAERWEVLVGNARQLAGFSNFLRPKKAQELMLAATSGPVVVFNIDETRCDALIIKPAHSEILHVPLAHFSYKKAVSRSGQWVNLVRSRNVNERAFIKPMPKSDDEFSMTLAAVWAEVVKPVLDILGYTSNTSKGDLPHITWCTTGSLSFFPLHAAGNYSLQSVAYDHVISSYTPSLSALLALPSNPLSFSGILAIGQTSTPGLPALPGTKSELARIQEQFQGRNVTQLDGDKATPAAVLAGMEEHSWVHLACHALQNTNKPTDSAFYLHNGTLNIAAIVQKQLKHAELAYLSACETAVGDQTLPEEAVHLAAGMLMAGYRTVIATMWSIRDNDAPLIAEKVYEHLLEGGVPDARRAAAAVHQATECLRAKVGVQEFTKWAPYIHVGL
ncbi:hypothetical protein BDV93DRAFT_444518 [Ceratobasidium sp. AG-I]|nr:hypothetical protein BDV93DRAFT_444518 [Ceratobasidium sp. AG-I]